MNEILKQVESEIEDDINLKYQFGVVTKHKITLDNQGKYKLEWRVGNNIVAFMNVKWDDKYNQWEGSWRVL